MHAYLTNSSALYSPTIEAQYSHTQTHTLTHTQTLTHTHSHTHT